MKEHKLGIIMNRLLGAWTNQHLIRSICAFGIRVEYNLAR